MCAKLNVPLTQDYRLIADDTQFTVQRRVIVDPTKAPGFAARYAADPTIDTEPRESWRDDGYHSLTAHGLTMAIQNVVVRQAVADGAETLKALLAAIQREMRTVTDAVDALLKPAESRYGSAEFPYVYHEDSVDGRTIVPESVARSLRRCPND